MFYFRRKKSGKFEDIQIKVVGYIIRDVVGLTELSKDQRVVNQDNDIWNGTMVWKEHRRLQVSQNITSLSSSK